MSDIYHEEFSHLVTSECELMREYANSRDSETGGICPCPFVIRHLTQFPQKTIRRRPASDVNPTERIPDEDSLSPGGQMKSRKQGEDVKKENTELEGGRGRRGFRGRY